MLDREVITKIFNEKGGNLQEAEKEIKTRLSIEKNLNRLIEKYDQKIEITVINLLFEECNYNYQDTEKKLNMMVNSIPPNTNQQLPKENKEEEKKVEREDEEEESSYSSFESGEEEEEQEEQEKIQKIDGNFIEFAKNLFPQYDNNLLEDLLKENEDDKERFINVLLSYDETNDEGSKEDQEEENEKTQQNTPVQQLAVLFPDIQPSLFPIILKENQNSVEKAAEYIFSLKESQEKWKKNKPVKVDWQNFSHNVWSSFSKKLEQESYIEEQSSAPKKLEMKEDPNSLATKLKFNLLNEKFGGIIAFEILEEVFVYSSYNLNTTIENLKSLYPWLNRSVSVNSAQQKKIVPLIPLSKNGAKKTPVKKAQFNLVKPKSRKKVKKIVVEDDEYDDSRVVNKDYNYYFEKSKFHASERRKYFMLANRFFTKKDYSSASDCMNKGKRHEFLLNKSNEIANKMLSSVDTPEYEVTEK